MIDWTKIYKKNRGEWVAVLDDEKTVVASGNSMERVIEEAKQKGHENPLVMRVPEEVVSFVGWNSNIRG